MIILPKAYARKDPNHLYQMQAADLVFDYLQKKTQNKDFQKENYEAIRQHSWAVHGIKLDQHLDQILDVLTEQHILTDHQYRHGVEKIQRKKLLARAFEEEGFANKTIDEFFLFYSRFCEYWIDSTRYYERYDLKDENLFDS